MFFQDNNKCLIYFQVKYCGWNYGCHCINPGRAERQSLENLFPWTKTPADVQILWLCSYSAQEAGGSSRHDFLLLCACLCQQEVTPQKELCLNLYSADSQCHKWGHKDNASKKPSPYKFQLHLQTWNFWGRDKMFVLATQSIYFSHTCCLPSKERGVLFFFFYFQLYICIAKHPNLFSFPWEKRVYTSVFPATLQWGPQLDHAN